MDSRRAVAAVRRRSGRRDFTFATVGAAPAFIYWTPFSCSKIDRPRAGRKISRESSAIHDAALRASCCSHLVRVCAEWRTLNDCVLTCR